MEPKQKKIHETLRVRLVSHGPTHIWGVGIPRRMRGLNRWGTVHSVQEHGRFGGMRVVLGARHWNTVARQRISTAFCVLYIFVSEYDLHLVARIKL